MHTDARSHLHAQLRAHFGAKVGADAGPCSGRTRSCTAAAAVTAVGLVLAMASASPVAAMVKAEPVRSDHPLVGLWRLPFPNSSCAEIYRIEANGTTLVTSADEVAESVFTLSDQPAASGFYKWVDKIVRDNGRKDCAGRITQPGEEVTRYILLHPEGKVFVLCEDEDEELNTCIGPFIRLEDADV